MRLPLFPLDTVLFPGCILDLQLFEARYLDMISRCLKADHGFGVVRILQGLEVGPAATAFAGIGCEAVIRDWQQQPNGLLGIRVEGQRRFDIERTEVQADQLAYLLPFQPEHKIELLQLEDVDLRLQRIQTLLERLRGV